ncbi:hypothetical protein PM038_00155 [Halorubrum ezzemoulense]|uniref:hypothetical protein n=1 Tax=Halorubrum ezzemoulense TaxID=337243 RepID=UPI00232AF5CD|nr:hypothetical protein [Halorubrum ezzemoulense]MDB2283687.1 hypothetical protein [Halorubrum ezzemoulense]
MAISDPSVFSPLVVGLLGIIGSIYIAVEGHPKKEYKEEVEKIQSDRWNSVCSALGPIFVDVYQHVNDDDNNSEDHDLTESDRASLLIRQALDGRSDLENLEETLEKLDEPKRVYKSCRRRWKRSISSFVSSIGASIAAPFFLFVSETTLTFAMGIFIFAASIGVFALAIYDLGKYQQNKTRLDEMLEEVDFM